MTTHLRATNLVTACIAVQLLLSACDSDNTATSVGQNGSTTTGTPGASVNTAIGNVLTFGAGNRTIYTFSNDTAGVSNCNGGCAQTWPPVTSPQPATANEFTTITREDGTYQWALHGFPLYYYQGDSSQGETNGEGIGNVWYVARPAPYKSANTSLGEAYVGAGSIRNASNDATNRSNYDGFTLYTFRNDSTGASACNGACAENWPPLFADNGSVNNNGFTLITRDDNTRQWAVNGKPLYFYQGDNQPADTNGNGVGGVWDIALTAN